MDTKKMKLSEYTDASRIGIINPIGVRPVALQSVSRDNPLYNMTKEKRGYAIIFKMENYNNPELYRRGASHDANKCKEAFEFLRFEVIIFSDLTKEQFLIELGKIRNKQLDKCSCLVVVFMGHGRLDEDTGKEYIILSDHQEVLTSELWVPFSADRCPALAGQPKLYFIQACRGLIKEHGIILKKALDWEPDTVSEDYVIPLYADMLIMWASYPDMPAIRDFQDSYGINGSVFFHYLCQVLQSDSEREDLSSMLLTVTHHVGVLYETETGVKQLPHLSSTLMRRVVLHEKARKLYEWITSKEKSEKLMEIISANE